MTSKKKKKSMELGRPKIPVNNKRVVDMLNRFQKSVIFFLCVFTVKRHFNILSVEEKL